MGFNSGFKGLMVPATLGGFGSAVKTVTTYKPGGLRVQISAGLRYISLFQNFHANTEIHLSSYTITVCVLGGEGLCLH